MGGLVANKQTYSEVYAVLSALGDKYIEKTPKEILSFIADNRDRNYAVTIDDTIPLDEQNLSEEAISLIAMLKLDYWCETEKEKADLAALLELNEQKATGQSLSKSSKEAWIKMLREKASKN